MNYAFRPTPPSPPHADAPCPKPTSWPRRLSERLDRVQGWIPALLVAFSVGDEILSRSRVGPDFAVFHRAAGRFLAGEPLYRLSDGHFCFKYSPAAAALLAPLGALPARTAQNLFSVASAVALVAFLRFAARMPGAPRKAWAVAAGVLYALPLYTHMFFLGQSDALLLALAVASESVAQRRPALSGALWAVTVLFKPPMAILGLVAAASREWRRLAWAGATTAALLAASLLRYGPSSALAQLGAWRGLLAATTPGLLCDIQNQSAYALACSLGGDPAHGRTFYMIVAVVGGGAAIALGAAVALCARRDATRTRPIAFASALYLAALLSPLGWRVNLLAALPLVHVALGLACHAPARWLRAACGAAVSARIVLGLASGNPLLSGTPALAAARFWGLSALVIALLATWGVALAATPGGASRVAAAVGRPRAGERDGSPESERRGSMTRR